MSLNRLRTKKFELNLSDPHLRRLVERWPERVEVATACLYTEANWQCQSCGRWYRKSGEALADFAKCIKGQNTQFLDWANQGAIAEIFEHPQRWTLTVAHLDHVPQNCDRTNLKAFCAPCHGSYDLKQMGRKLVLKAERAGQLRIDDALNGMQLALLPEVTPYQIVNLCSGGSMAVRRKLLDTVGTAEAQGSW